MGVGCETLFIFFLALESSLINLTNYLSLAFGIQKRSIVLAIGSALASLTTTSSNNNFNF